MMRTLIIIVMCLGLNTATAMAQDAPFRIMRSIFDVCVESAISGVVMAEEDLVAVVDLDPENTLGLNPINATYQFETGDHFECAVWAEAPEFDAAQFRSEAEVFQIEVGPTLSAFTPCSWGSTSRRWTLSCRISSVRHPNGWTYSFSAQFILQVNEFAAMVVHPLTATDPDGYLQIF